MKASTRSRSRSAARLAAVQALYQQEMEGTPIAAPAERIPRPSARRDDRGRRISRGRADFFDDIVSGVDSRRDRYRRSDRRQAGRGLDPGAARQADAGDPARRHL